MEKYQPDIIAVKKSTLDSYRFPPHKITTFMLGKDVDDWTLLIYYGYAVRAYEPTTADTSEIHRQVSDIIGLMRIGVI